MRRSSRLSRHGFRFILLLGLLSGHLLAVERPYLSPLALTVDPAGTRVFVAESGAGSVAEFDIPTGKVVRRYRVAVPLGGVALSPDADHLYVTHAAPDGQVHVINLTTRRLEDVISVGHTPGSVVVSPDGRRLFVCNRFSQNVSVVDLDVNRQTATIPVVREPAAAALTSDGRFLLVANLLPAGRADADDVAAETTIIDTAAGKSIATIRLPDGSTGLRGVCVSPDDKYAYVTHVLARHHLPATQIERGWINTNALSMIDLASRSLVNTVLIDDLALGAADPWGVACTRDGRFLCVAHAGTHEISAIDRVGLHDKLERVAAGEQVTEVSSSPEHVSDDLAFLGRLRKRIKLQGRGPRGLAVAGSRVFAAEYFSDSLGEVQLDPGRTPVVRSHALGVAQPVTRIRYGQMLFHDATLCFQHWHSCASCHPGEARMDGLNWDLLNDGAGNPKNTRSLLLAYTTPPAMASGVRSGAETAVRAGFAHIMLMVRPEDDAAAIDAYLRSLEPIPSPYLVRGELSEAAVRGRDVFASAGCPECHPDPLYTDTNDYDVGTGKGLDQDRAFDTPTLIELWRTAPYLHDGRARTVKEVLTQYNADDRHGHTSGLTESQISDVECFLLSQ